VVFSSLITLIFFYLYVIGGQLSVVCKWEERGLSNHIEGITSLERGIMEGDNPVYDLFESISRFMRE